MTVQDRHIIQKQCIELSFEHEETAFRLQQRVGATIQKIIAEKVEPVFNRLAGQGRYLRINRLEVDLGAVAAHNLDAHVAQCLPQRIEEAMIKELNTALKKEASFVHDYEASATGVNSQLVDNKSVVVDGFKCFLEEGALPWWAPQRSLAEYEQEVLAIFSTMSDTQKKEFAARLSSNPQAVQRLSRQFSSGFLQQFAIILASAQKALIEELVRLGKIETKAGGDIQAPKLFSDRKKVVAAIIPAALAHENHQHSSEEFLRLVVTQLAQAYQSVNEQEITQHIRSLCAHQKNTKRASVLMKSITDLYDNTLRLVDDKSLKEKNSRQPLRRHDTRRKKSGAEPARAQDDLEMSASSSSAHERIASGVTDTSITSDTKESPATSQSSKKSDVDEADTRIPEQTINDSSNNAPQGQPHGGSCQNHAVESHEQQYNQIVTERTSHKKRADAALSHLHPEETENQKCDAEAPQRPQPTSSNLRSAVKEDEPYYITNAGLVILTPFFPALFKELRLLEQNTFIDTHHRVRAVHIMQYLVSGEQQAPEYLLVLNKILCGIPVDEPVEREIVLTETETAECGRLLASVLTHWTALKNSSAEALRQAFLQRDGKVVRKENGWKLQVERKTIDVLISKIPWGFSVIKLPWNTDFIYVEW